MEQVSNDERMGRYAEVLHEFDPEARGPYVLTEYLAAAASAVIEVADDEAATRSITMQALADLRDRAAAAEAKVRSVESLARFWMSGPSANRDTMTNVVAGHRILQHLGIEDDS